MIIIILHSLQPCLRYCCMTSAFSGKIIVDAVLDRLIHQARRIELHGELKRKKKRINKE